MKVTNHLIFLQLLISDLYFDNVISNQCEWCVFSSFCITFGNVKWNWC